MIISQNRTKMSVDMKITKLNLIASWDICDNISNTCSLCRRLYVAPSLQELTNPNKKVLGNIVKGKCQHMFHSECMNDFINSGCQLCPICKTSWSLEKTIKSGAIYEQQQKIALKTVSK
mgnify:CR=1 FL=1